MFLKVKSRTKDGKTHRYWSIVESVRVHGGRIIHRPLLYLGELNDVQHAGWVRTIEVLKKDETSDGSPGQLALFPEDREAIPTLDCEAVRICVDKIKLRHPRQWGACWLALHLWDALQLDRFWAPLLPPSRKGTRWLNVLKALTCYRLIDPGSEFHFHRDWFLKTALGDLLGEDFALAQKDKPYRCLDRLLSHKEALFDFLKERWCALFGATYDLLLYDLTSTYFESDPPPPGSDSKKKFGYSRDHRSDCVQVVIALVVTPDGFPLAYEIYSGNTRDTATLEDFLDKIEKRFGKARRTWLMDRGIPTEETLEKMRQRKIQYLVGTPKGRLSRMEAALLDQPWSQARESVQVKILPQDEEFYVYVQSQDRVAKERSMRRRRLKRLWATLKKLRARKRLKRDDLLMALGAAKKEAGRAWGLVSVRTPEPHEAVRADTFSYELDRNQLRQTWRREGRYLLRAHMATAAPEAVWENYMLLARIEQAFKDVKGDLRVRPIWHQNEPRIEAHIFVSFLAYCLHTALRNMARGVAGGLTTAAILEKFKAIQMLDVYLPTTDKRQIVMSRHTEPETDVALLLEHLKLSLPEQPRPRVYADNAVAV